MCVTSGVTGVLYIGAGRLQEAIGLAPAMVSSSLLMVPAALLALHALRKPCFAGGLLEHVSYCSGKSAWRRAARLVVLCPAGS